MKFLIFLFRLASENNENAPPNIMKDSNRRVRPLYDIPYMFEAREFMRKKLISKKVRNSLYSFISVNYKNVFWRMKLCMDIGLYRIKGIEKISSKKNEKWFGICCIFDIGKCLVWFGLCVIYSILFLSICKAIKEIFLKIIFNWGGGVFKIFAAFSVLVFGLFPVESLLLLNVLFINKLVV